MKTITVNLINKTVEHNNQKCSFYEAGLYNNVDGDFSPITDKNDIEQYLLEKYEDVDTVEFADITDKRYEIKENIEQFLAAMNFLAEDIEEVLECQERDPHHSLLLFINEDGSTISVTPSDADVYFYILHDENDEDIITETLNDIRAYVDSGCLDEIL